jgi:glucose-6-phosphate 1-dehydrogenase
VSEAAYARLIGVGRAPQSTIGGGPWKEKRRSKLAATAEWVAGYRSQATFAGLKKLLNGQRVVFYLATPPETFSDIIRALGPEPHHQG